MRLPAPAGGLPLVCPPTQSGRLARVLYAQRGLVPVNDLGTQAYAYYCRVGGMVSRISWPTLLTRFRERKEGVTSL